MKYKKKTVLMLGALISLLTLSCSRSNYKTQIENLSNDVVLKWNEVAYYAFGGSAYQHSLMASRINAMMHIAMHDALNAIHPKYAAYSFNGKQNGADPIAAAASAAHAVLLQEIPAKKGFIDSALTQTLSTINDGDAKDIGIQLGKEAARAIISLREDDGSDGNPLAAGTDFRHAGRIPGRAAI